MRKIIIGSDHAGYKMKERIKKELGDLYEFVDMGTDSEESADYPIYGEKVAKQVAVTPGAQGVLVCGNGIGIAITANKVNGVRCALAYSTEVARGARQHNNANVVSVAGRSPMVDDSVDIVRTFLETEFPAEERHARRVDQMMEVENHN